MHPSAMSYAGSSPAKNSRPSASPNTPKPSPLPAAISASTSSQRPITGGGSSARARRLFDSDSRFPRKSRWQPGRVMPGTARAGRSNESFLDVDHFERNFVALLEPYRERVATLMFEFGTFPKAVFKTGADFSARLDSFLGALPGGFRYAVEIRNPEYLAPDYFAMLGKHNVAHVLNAWTRMPALADQVSLPGVFTADFTVVRALLRRGRNYEDAVERFQPYREIQEPDLPTRDAMVTIAASARCERKDAILFVNNRLEGNAPSTIEAVADKLFG